MPWEDPDLILKKHKLGREEYCQRMLTSLVLARPQPRWNTKNKPSEKGKLFLERLYELSFSSKLDSPLEFVDEFDLPAFNADEKGATPDYAIFTSTKLWIVELKTEAGSHRKEQLPMYAKRAQHHYPQLQVAMLYLTPEMVKITSPSFEVHYFAHLYWSDITALIKEVWTASPHKEECLLQESLQREIASLTNVPASIYRQDAEVIRTSSTLAELVQKTGEQQGVEITNEGHEHLIDLRLRIRDSLARTQGVQNVKPWIWYAETSGGTALTNLGRDVGCELRLSYYR